MKTKTVVLCQDDINIIFTALGCTSPGQVTERYPKLDNKLLELYRRFARLAS